MGDRGAGTVGLAVVGVMVPALAGIGLLVWLRTENGLLTVVAVAATVLFVGGIAWFQRRGATAQVRTAMQTGRIDVDAFLVMSSLPGTWPQDARRTLGLARDNAPAMPIRLTADDTTLHMWKTKYGSHPFTAQIALGDLVTVEAGDAIVMPIGSTLHLGLRDGSEVRLHVHLSRDDASSLAGLIRSRITAASIGTTPAGIVITSPPP